MKRWSKLTLLELNLDKNNIVDIKYDEMLEILENLDNIKNLNLGLRGNEIGNDYFDNIRNLR